MKIDHFSSKVGAILESSPVEKSMIIPYFLLVVITLYIFFDLFFLLNPSLYISNAAIERILPLKVVILMTAIIMVLLRKKLELSKRAQKIVPYVFTLFYVISLMTLGYQVGHLSIVSGVVIAAAPLISMILFERAVTAVMVVVGVITFLVISILYVTGILPYAPFFISTPNPSSTEKAFYLCCMIFYMLPYLISFMLGTYILVEYWQSREDATRRVGLIDSLTEMANRRAISIHLADLTVQRGQVEPLSIILVDVDYFKKVNDTFGHSTGDLVLRRVGDSIKNSLRGLDRVGRYGGEEFLIVLANTNLDCAQQIAERCRLKIENELILTQDNQSIQVTASFGVYCSVVHGEGIAEMIHAADIQLYRAKEEGRNRICLHEAIA